MTKRRRIMSNPLLSIPPPTTDHEINDAIPANRHHPEEPPPKRIYDDPNSQSDLGLHGFEMSPFANMDRSDVPSSSNAPTLREVEESVPLPQTPEKAMEIQGPEFERQGQPASRKAPARTKMEQPATEKTADDTPTADLPQTASQDNAGKNSTRETPKSEHPPSDPIPSDAPQKKSDERALQEIPESSEPISKSDKGNDRSVHWSRFPIGSLEFQIGISRLMENVPGYDPIDRYLYLYTVLPKDSTGSLTGQSWKILHSAHAYNQGKIVEFMITESVLNVAGGPTEVVLAHMLKVALARLAVREGILSLGQIAKLWHPIANKMRTLAVLKTNKGYYYAVRGGTLTKTQKAIFDKLGFKFVDEVSDHAEQQVLKKALQDGAEPELLLISKAACGKPGHRCATAAVDFVEGFKGEMDPTGMAVKYTKIE